MTPIGIFVAVGAIMMSMMMDGGKPMALINIPSLLLVFGGTFGATFAGSLGKDAKQLPKLLKVAMRKQAPYDLRAFAGHLMEVARGARAGGMKVIENELPEVKDDRFAKLGVELITTTSDPDRVRGVLEAEIMGMMDRHGVGTKTFTDMAGFAPTVGILGTVIGLVHVLGSLTTPGKLGPAIATAFTATLWGVLSANLFWLPIANRLKRLSGQEVTYRELIVEGLLAVQEGLSGPQLRDRLEPFLAPKDRQSEASEAAA